MESLLPYIETSRRNYSFLVKYKFYLVDEVGFGRVQPPYQHYRCDFGYAEEVDTYIQANTNKSNGFRLFMIFPEFLDENGLPILEKKSVNKEGVAAMWIIDENWIPYHKRRITIGTKCYFMEGCRKVAECEIIELNWE